MMRKTTLLIFTFLIIQFSASAQNPTDTIKTANPIMMVGNSITFQGNWKTVLHRNDVTNWGIPGYTTEQISWTLKHIISEKPKICFLEGGINDLTLGISPERVFQNQVKMMDSLLAHRIKPVLQSTVYQNPSPDENRRVKEVNRLLKDYCAAHHIDYIDLNQILSENGYLKKDLTIDGTHLKPAAYQQWAVLVEEELKKAGF